jgi:MoaA/NifB/PqqE/SkfB family radical SAM enzyme
MTTSASDAGQGPGEAAAGGATHAAPGRIGLGAAQPEPRAPLAGGHDAPWAQHEEAAHEERAWVRLTYECNNRCIFCLDSDTHDGEIRTRDAVFEDILAGRRRGATRLILSGGEPTIHPNFLEFVRVGHRAGYRRVQTVTNGRLFAYPEALRRCVDAGLGEITFSIHGPNARIHDALVGVKGAYEQEITGLKWALADGRPIVNVDVCVNRANVKHLRALLDGLLALGVREFDLLQVVPFGRAYQEGKETLFYTLDDETEALHAAFEVSRRPDVHLWLNRFPIQHLEGFEELAQDPHKLLDEVRGRQEEFARLFETGEALDCRQPERCKHCYLEPLCDGFDALRADLAAARYDVVRLDAAWEDQPHTVAGSSDPASVKWIAMQAAAGHAPGALPSAPLEAVAARSGASALWVVAPAVAAARAAMAGRFAGLGELELELADAAGLSDALDADGHLDGRRVTRLVARDAAQAEALAAALERLPDAELLVWLTRDTWPWLLAHQDALAGRLAVRQPAWDKLSDARAEALDLTTIGAALRPFVPVEGLPECLLGRPPRSVRRVLDTTRHRPDERLEVFRATRRFIEEDFRVKSLRCRGCARVTACQGLHANTARAQGLGMLAPIRD